MPAEHPGKTRISIAEPSDRPAIYTMRHQVYAEELGQHKTTHDQKLTDSLDSFNVYIVAKIGGELAGFVSITPPGFGKYSIDKYIARDPLHLSFDDGLYEIRVLTVARQHRGSRVASVLMYAAGRWVEERNGKQIVAMGRTEVLSIYLKHGFKRLNHEIKSGAVTFELLETSLQQLREFVEQHHSYYKKLCGEFQWGFSFPFFKPACCFHGGEFFNAIGTSFDTLERRDSIINADVLDAWFPPSPIVIDTLRTYLPWLMSTSPPTHSEGLRIGHRSAQGG